MALHHAAAGEKVHLVSVGDIADAKTAAIVKTDAFETAQLLLRAGERIASHAVRGYATIYCIDGAVVLHSCEDMEVRGGDWLYLDRGQVHSLSAIEDSSLLLTILFE